MRQILFKAYTGIPSLNPALIVQSKIAPHADLTKVQEMWIVNNVIEAMSPLIRNAS